MNNSVKFENDCYVIGSDFRLISFNKAVEDRYSGIKVGDLCYKATMNRDTPCLHCPIAGNSNSCGPIYFDPFYNDWVEAIFSQLDDDKFGVTCRRASVQDFKLIGEERSSELKKNVHGKAVNEELQKQVNGYIQLLGGFNKIFFSICIMDLVNDTFKLVSTIDSIKNTIGEEGITSKSFKLMESFILPESREDMREFNDFSTLTERLGDKAMLTLDYLGVSSGWSRAVVIPIGRDENGEVTKIIYALRSIQGQKEKELYQQAALEEQMAIIKGLAEDYYSVMIVDYSTDSVRIYRENSEEGHPIGDFFRVYDTWSEGVKAYADAYVAEEDREIFLRALSTEYISESTGDYSLNYHIQDGKERTHLRFKVAHGKDKAGAKFAVVGLKNVDKEYRDQVKLQKAREEASRSYSIVSGLSREYHTLWFISAEDHIMHLYRSNSNTSLSEMLNKRFDGSDFEKFISFYTDTYVDENDRQRVREAADYDTLIKNIDEKGFVNINYLRHDDKGDECYHQMSFAKAEDRDSDSSDIVLAFRNVDTIVKEELEKQKILREALAAAEHANRSKTTFLNNMSHDIRTPMNAIIGFTALAASHIDNTEQVRGYLEKIQISGKHLLSLINDVLDMSRIESGKVTIEEKETHLPEVIHDLRTIVQADITSKQLDFFIDTVDVVNEDVICDKLRLSQVLMNILNNAMKFTGPGGFVSLRIVQKPCSVSGYAQYEFRIRDNGIGMKKEFISHVFEPFEREASSTVSGIQGTGLGMTITKNIVDMMGGTITVESELNKGSEFIVSLRFKVGKKKAAEKPSPELSGLRVLVADDDSETCMNICKMLSSVGMRSEWTSYGKEAVIRARFAVEQDDEFNAYIIDWLMPDMNGIEVVRRIRRIIGESKPIIILTAYDWADIEEEAREAGVTAFCSKPLFMSELKDVFAKSAGPEIKCKAKKKTGSVSKGKKILLVEDNELNREIATEILKEAGFVIFTAEDGSKAVEMMKNAERGQYDLILMDIQMPIMDGYEATKQIRTLPDKEIADIPILAMTANAFEEDRENAIAAGMNGHIAKPIEIPKLFEAIEEAFKITEKNNE